MNSSDTEESAACAKLKSPQAIQPKTPLKNRWHPGNRNMIERTRTVAHCLQIAKRPAKSMPDPGIESKRRGLLRHDMAIPASSPTLFVHCFPLVFRRSDERTK